MYTNQEKEQTREQVEERKALEEAAEQAGRNNNIAVIGKVEAWLNNTTIGPVSESDEGSNESANESANESTESANESDNEPYVNSELRQANDLKRKLSEVIDQFSVKIAERDERFREMEALAVTRAFQIDSLESRNTAQRNDLRALGEELEAKSQNVRALEQQVQDLREELRLKTSFEAELRSQVSHYKDLLQDVSEFLGHEVENLRAKRIKINESPESP